MAILTGHLSWELLAGFTGMKEAHASASDQGSQDDSRNARPDAQAKKRHAHYVAGPGFEMAIRATLSHPLEVDVKGSGQESKDRPRDADREHKHDSLERRLDSLEKAMLMVVDQLQRIDRKLS